MTWTLPARPPDPRPRQVGLGLSLLLHGLILLLSLGWTAPHQAEVHPIQVQFLAPGPVPKPGPARGVDRRKAPRAARSPARSRLAPAPPAPVAPNGTLAVASPVPERAEPGPPQSFRDWQAANRSPFLPQGNPFGYGGGGTDGEDGMVEVVSRDRCEPTPGRRFATLYLLFDSSGSMSPIRRSEALGCAHQYAKAAILAGSAVVIGNFARNATFTGPTHEMEDVEIALRGITDNTATVLPSAELEPFLSRNPSEDAELVVVSDGMFANDRQILDWYQSFLARNPGNRATMYTVGSPGHGEAVAELRDVGMDVFMYEQIHRQ